MKELLSIQQKLNAPKNQYNSFGKYAYRSCEDILMAVKPLLAETDCSLTCNDDIVLVGDRFYVKATYTLTNKEGKTASASAFAREQDKVTGQIEAQITGAASSYARKYALNALFAIDDNKDPDATNTHDKTKPEETPKKASTRAVKPKAEETPGNPIDEALKAIDEAKTRADLEAVYHKYLPIIGKDAQFLNALNTKANALKQDNPK